MHWPLGAAYIYCTYTCPTCNDWPNCTATSHVLANNELLYFGFFPITRSPSKFFENVWRDRIRCVSGLRCFYHNSFVEFGAVFFGVLTGVIWVDPEPCQSWLNTIFASVRLHHSRWARQKGVSDPIDRIRHQRSTRTKVLELNTYACCILSCAKASLMSNDNG